MGLLNLAALLGFLSRALGFTLASRMLVTGATALRSSVVQFSHGRDPSALRSDRAARRLGGSGRSS
jgi:hypothetical protein